VHVIIYPYSQSVEVRMTIPSQHCSEADKSSMCKWESQAAAAWRRISLQQVI